MKSTFWAYLLAYFCIGCAGPTSSFGPFNSFTKQVTKEDLATTSQTFNSEQGFFDPPFMLFHKAHDLEIKIPYSTHAFKVFHNGLDISAKFQIDHEYEEQLSRLTYEKLKWSPYEKNQFIIAIQKTVNAPYEFFKYQEPSCLMRSDSEIQTYGDFTGKSKYFNDIQQVAENHNLNPSFLAGLVAQESSFNPKAVSWAKAIGLTQVTNMASSIVLENEQTWPRYPGIEEMSYLKVKSLILAGKINHLNEWRLNPARSIEGGAYYLRYIEKYWAKKIQSDPVGHMIKSENLDMPSIYLASYNSGPARVRAAILKQGKNWKNYSKLREARKYLRQVNSFCSEFRGPKIVVAQTESL